MHCRAYVNVPMTGLFLSDFLAANEGATDELIKIGISAQLE